MLSDDEIWSRWKFPADWSWKQSVINLARVIEREARRHLLAGAIQTSSSTWKIRRGIRWKDCTSIAAVLTQRRMHTKPNTTRRGA